MEEKLGLSSAVNVKESVEYTATCSKCRFWVQETCDLFIPLDGILCSYLQGSDLVTPSNDESCDYFQEASKRNGKLILVIGCGRSGTVYAKKVFEQFGYQIGHEKWKDGGMSSWFWGDDKTRENYFKGASHLCDIGRYGFNSDIKKRLVELKTNGKAKGIYVFHQVRHPLHVISSFVHRWKLESIHKMVPEIDENDEPLVKSMKYWYYWNLKLPLIFHRDLVYKVEEIATESVLSEICKIIDEPYSEELRKKVDKIDKFTNGRYMSTERRSYTHRYSWSELDKVDLGLCNQIKLLAQVYGYKMTEADEIIVNLRITNSMKDKKLGLPWSNGPLALWKKRKYIKSWIEKRKGSAPKKSVAISQEEGQANSERTGDPENVSPV